jgi:hypothetical protein
MGGPRETQGKPGMDWGLLGNPKGSMWPCQGLSPSTLKNLWIPEGSVGPTLDNLRRQWQKFARKSVESAKEGTTGGGLGQAGTLALTLINGCLSSSPLLAASASSLQSSANSLVGAERPWLSTLGPRSSYTKPHISCPACAAAGSLLQVRAACRNEAKSGQ